MTRRIRRGFLDEFQEICSLIITSSEKNNGIWRTRRSERGGEERLAIIRGLKQLGIIHRMPGGWDEYEVHDLDLLRAYQNKPPVSTFFEWVVFYKRMPRQENGEHLCDVESCFELLDRAVMATRDPEAMYLSLIERLFRRLKLSKKKSRGDGDKEE